jgi:Arm DNA-binding domain
METRANPSNFTDRFVNGLPFSDAPIYYWDEALPGFGIRTGKTRKTFTVIRGKRRERVSIGQYPATSLQDARRKAKLLLATPAR